MQFFCTHLIMKGRTSWHFLLETFTSSKLTFNTSMRKQAKWQWQVNGSSKHLYCGMQHKRLHNRVNHLFLPVLRNTTLTSRGKCAFIMMHIHVYTYVHFIQVHTYVYMQSQICDIASQQTTLLSCCCCCLLLFFTLQY